MWFRRYNNLHNRRTRRLTCGLDQQILADASLGLDDLDDSEINAPRDRRHLYALLVAFSLFGCSPVRSYLFVGSVLTRRSVHIPSALEHLCITDMTKLDILWDARGSDRSYIRREALRSSELSMASTSDMRLPYIHIDDLDLADWTIQIARLGSAIRQVLMFLS